jgi:hypothetical protein
MLVKHHDITGREIVLPDNFDQTSKVELSEAETACEYLWSKTRPSWPMQSFGV